MKYCRHAIISAQCRVLHREGVSCIFVHPYNYIHIMYVCMLRFECTVCLCVCCRMYCILHVGVLYCMSNKEVTFVCRCTRGWAQCGVNCVGTSCGDCGLKAISAQVRGRGCAGGWERWGEVRVTFQVDRDSTSTVSNAISAPLAS